MTRACYSVIAAAVAALQTTSGNEAVVMKGRAPVSDAPVHIRLPVPVTFDLSNGLHVVVLSDHRAPQVAFTLVIPGAGGYFDPAARPGLATFTAAMMREGTPSRSSEALARQLEILSASLEVSATVASPDATISGTCLREDFPTLVDVVADVLRHPAFAETELGRYKERTRAAFAQQRSRPGTLATELFARLVNAPHPSARTMPTVEALDATTRAELVGFHAAHYVPDRAALLIAGDVTVTGVRRLVIGALGGWPRAGDRAPVVVDPPDRSNGGIHLIARPNSVQTTFVVGAPAVSRTSRDFEALQVMNQVLGAGPTGRLFVHLREEKGYTYAIVSLLTAGRYRGAWTAITDVRSDITDLALRDLLAEIARMRDEPVDALELRRQQHAIVAAFALTLESPRQLLDYYQTQWLYRLPADYWARYQERIMSVTAADVQRVARTYLDPSRLQIVAVGDPSQVRDRLSRFGEVAVDVADARIPR